MGHINLERKYLSEKIVDHNAANMNKEHQIMNF